MIKGEELQSLTILAGEDITLPVHFEGSPPPSVTWTVDNEDLIESDRITFQERKGFSQLTIKEALISDAGTYKLQLRNKAGEEKTSCRVIVHGNHYFESLNVNE